MILVLYLGGGSTKHFVLVRFVGWSDEQPRETRMGYGIVEWERVGERWENGKREIAVAM